MEKTFTRSELEAIAQALADTVDGLSGSEIGRRAILQFIREAMKAERYARASHRFEPL
jgi:hypothetical protein